MNTRNLIRSLLRTRDWSTRDLARVLGHPVRRTCANLVQLAARGEVRRTRNGTPGRYGRSATWRAA